jgi:hypothetical protein
MSKTCIKCNITKDLNEFYTHVGMSDGHLNMCIECAKLYAKRHRPEIRKELKIYEKYRNKQPSRKLKQLEYSRNKRKKDIIKYRARTAVGNALRDKRLIKEPCCLCGSTEKVEAHHSDYSKPLAIVWKCFKCHRESEHHQVVLDDL